MRPIILLLLLCADAAPRPECHSNACSRTLHTTDDEVILLQMSKPSEHLAKRHVGPKLLSGKAADHDEHGALSSNNRSGTHVQKDQANHSGKDSGNQANHGSTEKKVKAPRRSSSRHRKEHEGKHKAKKSKDGTWLAADVPNPQAGKNQYERCGLKRKGWLCDPDNLLSTDGKEQIQDVMEKVRQTGQATSNPLFEVACVVVKKFDTTDWQDFDIGAAGDHFTDELAYRWGLGNQDDFRGLLLSIETSSKSSYIRMDSTMLSEPELEEILADRTFNNWLLRKDYSMAAVTVFNLLEEALGGNACSLGAPVVAFFLPVLVALLSL